MRACDALRYLKELVATARTGRLSRRSLTALQAQLTAGAQHPTERQQHFAEAYAATTTRAADVYAVGHINHLQRADVCALYLPPCRGTRGTATGVGGGVRLSFGKVGGVVEVMPGRQFTGSVRLQEADRFHTRTLDWLFEHRETSISMLFRYELTPDRAVTLGVLAGPSILLQDGRRIYVDRSPRPLPVSPPIEEDPSQLGLTFGAESTLHFAKRFGMVAPIRLVRSVTRHQVPCTS